MIKSIIIFMLGLLIGSMFIVTSEITYCTDGDGLGNDWGCIDFNYALPQGIVNWLNNRAFVLEVIQESDFTRVTYNLDSVDDENVKELVNSYDAQRTYLKHQEVNLLGLDMPIGCGRDRVTNELYAVFIDNGSPTFELVEECMS